MGWGIMILSASGRLSIMFVIMNYIGGKPPILICETDLRAKGAKRPPTAGLGKIFMVLLYIGS